MMLNIGTAFSPELMPVCPAGAIPEVSELGAESFCELLGEAFKELTHMQTEVNPLSLFAQTEIEPPQMPEVQLAKFLNEQLSCKPDDEDEEEIIPLFAEVNLQILQLPEKEAEPEASEIPKIVAENPQITSESPQITSENPESSQGEQPQINAEAPKISGETPQITAEAPKIATEPPQITAEAPIITAEAPVGYDVQRTAPAFPQKAETPVGYDVHSLPKEAETPQAEQAVKELFGKVKLTTENQVQSQTEKPESDETLKSWDTFQKARVEIKEKPEEMNQLLERYKAVNSEKPEKAEKAEIPVGREANDTPKKAEADAMRNTEQPKKAEAPVMRDAPEAPKIVFSPKPVVVSEEKPLLPQSQVVRISSEITARLETAKNGTTTFEMTLNPVELGKITVKLVMKAAKVTVQIVAENAKTAQLLQNSADRIGAVLDKGEAKLESFVVSVEQKSDYSEQRENQNQNREEQEQPQDEAAEEENGISFAELLQEL